MKLRAVLVVLLLIAAACSGDDDDGGGEAAPSTTSTTAAVAEIYPDHSSEVYADPASWLCRPDVDDDVCDDDLDATVLDADGTTRVEAFTPAEEPAVDCFYVYPTISMDPGANSDMTPGDEEVFVVRQQAARLAAACRLFAPVYRQTTLTALVERMGGGAGAGPDSREIAYGDVLDAWKHYIANDNEGRGVVIVGHSQGAGHLSRLLEEEIDPSARLRERLVSAMLIGSTVHGSTFDHVRECTAEDDTGCIVAFATFRSTAPPPANSFFARPEGSESAICTNPAAMTGGEGDLDPYFDATGASILGGSNQVEWGAAIETPFVTLPDLVTAECVTSGDGFHYLELRIHGDPATPRVDDIRGDLTPEWGMHLVDVSVAMGDLVDLVASQAEAYAGAG